MASNSNFSSRRVASAPPKPNHNTPAWSCWGSQNTETRPNSGLLTELMMKHGRQLEKFPLSLQKYPRLQCSHDRSYLSNAWYCNNKAFRQMYCTSAKTPRRRTFASSVTLAPDNTRVLEHVTMSRHGSTESPETLRVQRTRSAPPTRFHRQQESSEIFYSVIK